MNIAPFTVTMTSDWHVGTGFGGVGGTDRETYRDESGLPAIPSTELKGLFRDAFEWLLAEAKLTNSDRILNALFGNDGLSGSVTTEGCLAFRHASYPDAIRKVAATRPDLQRAATFLKPFNLVEQQSGTASDDMLGTFEMARIGAELTTAITSEVTFGPSEWEVIERCLCLAAGYLVRVGSKRTRGFGTCVVTGSWKPSSAAKILEEVKNLDGLTFQPAPPSPVALTTSNEKNRYRYTLEITLKLPAVFPTAVTGNHTSCDNKIPPTVLFATIAKLLESRGVAIRPWIEEKQLRVLGGYPSNGVEEGYPCPLHLQVPKHQSDTLINRWLPYEPEDFPQLKPINGHITFSGEKIERVALLQQSILRLNMRQAEPLPLTMDAHATGTRYICHVIAPSADLKEHLSAEIRLGVAKSVLGWAEVNCSSVSKWEELPTPPLTDTGEVRFWLLSDMVSTRPDRPLDEQWMSAVAASLGIEPTKIEVIDFIAKTTRIESWAAATGRPRPTLRGLAAGSVFKCKIDGLTLEQAQKFERDGVGLRTSEGFGRVAINHPIMSQNGGSINWPFGQVIEPSNLPSDENDFGLERRAIEHQIAEAIELHLYRAEFTRSQSMAGTIRGIVSTAKDLAEVRSQVEGLLKLRSDEQFLTDLMKFLQKPDEFWKEIGLDKLNESTTLNDFLLPALRHWVEGAAQQNGQYRRKR